MVRVASQSLDDADRNDADRNDALALKDDNDDDDDDEFMFV